MSKCETREQFDVEAEAWRRLVEADRTVRLTKKYGEWCLANVQWLLLLTEGRTFTGVEHAKREPAVELRSDVDQWLAQAEKYRNDPRVRAWVRKVYLDE